MLTQKFHTDFKSAQRQSGVILLVALIMLVIMTLAGIALARSVDTASIIAGNLSFQQAATLSGDRGIETAVAWLDNNPTILDTNNTAAGYAADGLTSVPNKAAGDSWDTHWAAVWEARKKTEISAEAGTGMTVSYVIDRLCAAALPPTGGGGCAASPVVGGENCKPGDPCEGLVAIASSSPIYYRITARVDGPRNSRSYVQAIVSK
jgi:Tfp pilus assembly protein PilX